MKFLLPALCLVTPVATALPGSLLRRHLADVSETCLSETQALLENSGVSQAYTALEAAVATAGSCANNDNNNNNKARCTMEFQGLSQDYAQACETAGGRTVSLTAQLDCDLSTSASTMGSGFEFVYQNMVDCVSTNCDLTNVNDKIDSDMETSQQTLETSQGALCKYQITDFAGGTAPTTPTTETTDAPNPAPTPSAAAWTGGVVASAAVMALTLWNVVV